MKITRNTRALSRTGRAFYFVLILVAGGLIIPLHGTLYPFIIISALAIGLHFIEKRMGNFYEDRPETIAEIKNDKLYIPDILTVIGRNYINISDVERIRIETIYEEQYPLKFYLINDGSKVMPVRENELDKVLEFIRTHMPDIKITKMLIGNRPDIVI